MEEIGLESALKERQSTCAKVTVIEAPQTFAGFCSSGANTAAGTSVIVFDFTCSKRCAELRASHMDNVSCAIMPSIAQIARF
eukprot:s605_g11.t1